MDDNPSPILSSLQNEPESNRQQPITLTGESLSFDQIEDFLAKPVSIALPNPTELSNRLLPSVDCLNRYLDDGHNIYGVNTLFGGLANESVDNPTGLQEYLIKSHMVSLGDDLEQPLVRLTMLLRVNSLLKGASAVRPLILERLVALINLGVTPRIKNIGSIGASGDLVPLSAMAGAAFGLSDAFELLHDGEYKPAPHVLAELGFAPIQLQHKEGLALINGTSCHTAITVASWLAVRRLFSLHLSTSLMIAECLHADPQAFHPFVHKMRPHPGQIRLAAALHGALTRSAIVAAAADHHQRIRSHQLVQDRYSIRCLAQFLGPLWEDLKAIGERLAIEVNSASDNPLFDPVKNQYYFGGNFLGQNVALDADKLRIILCLLAKHNDAHIAYLIDPQVNRGLPASLALLGDGQKTLGVKPLQIASNSIVPLLEQQANPMVTHFPIHAEQGNQNVNSQAFGSANITQNSIRLFSKQLSITLLIACHAASFRLIENKPLRFGELFCRETGILLSGVYDAIGQNINANRVLVDYHNADQQQRWLQRIEKKLIEPGRCELSVFHNALFD